MGVNYLGGGVTNVEKPSQYYEIIDKRNNVTKANPVSVAKKFDSVLKSVKTKGVYDSKVKPVSLIERNKLIKPTKIKVLTLAEQRIKSQAKISGTDIALKRLSKEMENQLYGMFWTMIDGARNSDHEGGFAEKLFRGPYLAEIVKTSSDAELGEIGEAIYRGLADKQIAK